MSVFEHQWCRKVVSDHLARIDRVSRDIVKNMHQTDFENVAEAEAYQEIGKEMLAHLSSLKSNLESYRFE